MDRGAWQAIVLGVTKSLTRLRFKNNNNGIVSFKMCSCILSECGLCVCARALRAVSVLGLALGWHWADTERLVGDSLQGNPNCPMLSTLPSLILLMGPSFRRPLPPPSLLQAPGLLWGL